MKVYMDACCLSRLTDDQSQTRIREEAIAVESIFAEVRLGKIDLIASEALTEEARRNPFPPRRLDVEALLSLAAISIEVDSSIAQRARELNTAGYSVFDALHLAAAESAGADVLLTTDDRLIKRAARGIGRPRIPVRNPVSWNKEQGI